MIRTSIHVAEKKMEDSLTWKTKPEEHNEQKTEMPGCVVASAKTRSRRPAASFSDFSSFDCPKSPSNVIEEAVLQATNGGGVRAGSDVGLDRRPKSSEDTLACNRGLSSPISLLREEKVEGDPKDRFERQFVNDYETVCSVFERMRDITLTLRGSLKNQEGSLGQYANRNTATKVVRAQLDRKLSLPLTEEHFQKEEIAGAVSHENRRNSDSLPLLQAIEIEGIDLIEQHLLQYGAEDKADDTSSITSTSTDDGTWHLGLLDHNDFATDSLNFHRKRLVGQDTETRDEDQQGSAQQGLCKREEAGNVRDPL